MRCGCPNCGTYMIQAERGLLSGCVCPACNYICRDCMGHEQKPLSPESFEEEFLLQRMAKHSQHDENH